MIAFVTNWSQPQYLDLLSSKGLGACLERVRNEYRNVVELSA